MKRRNILAALGTLSAGGAFTVGSGAFSSVSAERGITVNVADDTDAFLRLAPCTGSPNGKYVDNTDGLLTIDLSAGNENDPPGGSGVNPEALSVFHNVFEIGNQGTQDVCVDFEVDVPPIPDDADVPDRYEFDTGDPAVVFYRGSSRDDYVINNRLDTDRDGAISLPLQNGSSECIGFEVRAFGFDSGEDLFEEVDLTIRADADADCQLADGTDPSDPTPTNPLAHWPFDDGDIETDPVIDASGNGNNGSVENPDGASSAEGVDGIEGNAAEFGGDGAYVKCDPLEIEDGLTVSAWVYPEQKSESYDFPENLGVVSQYPGSSQDKTWIFEIDSDLSGTRFWDGTGGGNWLHDETEVPEEEWTHVAAVWEQNERREIYVNGELRASDEAALDENMDVDNIQTRIGYTGDNNRYFQGRLDEVRVYNRDLTATEIRNLADEYDP
ncbi:DUF1102 family protein [Halalkaliarchaeum sp. AArc-CO]|uniref:LamG-like jellyroll fold domain-containing protein n=1 Tax=Halalkaliarchaeum sp. AArc-CO TaxID=2866381 RepID=UPI00217CF088|nr:LamG-like jellyroll fold domain-containing protein [Halalkaliarchaeum sp. AArc-CO]UWG51841.1 DUF1102 family protein [Halalkaliarchaeum sp. AArc-CO]